LQRRVYAEAPTRTGRRELVVDLYRPMEGPVKGAVVVMHGGGFTESYVDIGENKVYGQSLAQRGYLAAAIAFRSVEDEPAVSGWAEEYAAVVRGLGDPRVDAAVEELGPAFPDAVAAAGVDLVTAVRWLRSRAGELGFDPGRVAVFGASSGSVSAITTAYAMELYGEGNLEVAAVIDLRGLLLRAEGAGNPFRPDDPPLLMLHGEEDRSFRLPEVEAFFQLARDAGAPVQLYTSPEHGHELGGPGLLALRVDGKETVLDRIDAFLEAAFRGEGMPGGSLRGRLLPAEGAGSQP
ncbi:MAG TPA: alpha/beta hydrolase, partial [Longimicrobiales bacterium]|nr:alpha/beta hydrolase [Longimicrobiales bacterium]